MTVRKGVTMRDVDIRVISNSKDLPPVESINAFHSNRLFCLFEQTPRIKPLMITATDCHGEMLGCVVASVRYRWTWLPPFLYSHCRIYGEGDYAADLDDKDKEYLFGQMLAALTDEMSFRALYVEWSNLSSKMFGYRLFRVNGYFPVHWMSIHNSLHSMAPQDRLSDKMIARIRSAESKGVTTERVSDDEGMRSFMRLLTNHNRMKPRRYIPDKAFFEGLRDSPEAALFITRYQGKAIGCSALFFSGNDAYLWYSAFLRKSYIWLHPDIVTIWHAIDYSYQKGCGHIRFMDVGLPFKRNRFREFILRFGGKPVSTYRWFKCNIRWINKLLSWFYRG